MIYQHTYRPAPARHPLRAYLRPIAHRIADLFDALSPLKVPSPAQKAAHPTRDDMPVFALALVQGTHGGSTVEIDSADGSIRTQTHDAERRDCEPTRHRTAQDIIDEVEAAAAIRANGRMWSIELATWRMKRKGGRG